MVPLPKLISPENNALTSPSVVVSDLPPAIKTIKVKKIKRLINRDLPNFGGKISLGTLIFPRFIGGNLDSRSPILLNNSMDGWGMLIFGVTKNFGRIGGGVVVVICAGGNVRIPLNKSYCLFAFRSKLAGLIGGLLKIITFVFGVVVVVVEMVVGGLKFLLKWLV